MALYLLVALSARRGLGLIALAACYVVAFVAVVAEWFGGRWFATGLAWSGVMVSIASSAIVGWVPVLAIMGGLDLLVVVSLAGNKMAARYDLQRPGDSATHMDEFGVARLRKTVTARPPRCPA